MGPLLFNVAIFVLICRSVYCPWFECVKENFIVHHVLDDILDIVIECMRLRIYFSAK